jgi:hypothetical protein
MAVFWVGEELCDVFYSSASAHVYPAPPLLVLVVNFVEK